MTNKSVFSFAIQQVFAIILFGITIFFISLLFISDVYKHAVIGALYEMFIIPAHLGLIIIGLYSVIEFIRSKFNFKSLNFLLLIFTLLNFILVFWIL